MKCQSVSHVLLFVTPWTVAHQALLSMGFSRQEYWSGLPFPSSGDLSNPWIKPGSPTLQADSSLIHREAHTSAYYSTFNFLGQTNQRTWIFIMFQQ